MRRDLTYKTVNDAPLKMDLYLPPGATGDSRYPAVMIVNGIGSLELKDWGQYRDWASLIAASGMAAVPFQSRQIEPIVDTRDLIEHVRKNAAALNIDENRLGVWGCSANVGVALPLAMQPERTYPRAAVFYYGVMAEMPLRQDVPVLVARAGLDAPNLNASIDNFVRRALNEDVTLTLINYVDGRHGFELIDDTPESRAYVQQTLDFLKLHLTRPANMGPRVPTPGRFLAMIGRDGIEKAVQVYRQGRTAQPNAPLYQENILNGIGYQLLQAGKVKAALEVFKLNAEANPNSANVYDSLGDAYEADGNHEEAIRHAEKALELLKQEQTGLSENMRDAIRTSAEGKPRRLKKQ